MDHNGRRPPSILHLCPLKVNANPHLFMLSPSNAWFHSHHNVTFCNLDLFPFLFALCTWTELSFLEIIQWLKTVTTTRAIIFLQQPRMMWSSLTQTQQCFLPLSLQTLEQHAKLVTPQPSVTVRDDSLTTQMRDEAGRELGRGMKTQSSAVTSNHSDRDISETIGWVRLSVTLDRSVCSLLHQGMHTGHTFGHKNTDDRNMQFV